MVSVTSKSVRDHNQKATLKGDSIEIVSYVGRQKAFNYSFSVSLWEKAEKGFGNPNWHKHELVNRYHDKRTDSPEQECVRDRIVDAQVSAIEQLMKKVRGV